MWSVHASKHTSIHTHAHNEVTLVWGSLRLAPIILVCHHVCVCVKAREGEEREGEREGESERGRDKREGDILVHGIQYRCMCTYQDNVHVMYISHGLDTNAMLLPGQVPGYKDSDVKLLPSSTMKHAIWELFYHAAAASSMWAVVYSTFTDFGASSCPT